VDSETSLDFSLARGFPGDRGSISYESTDQSFRKAQRNTREMMPGNYPDLIASSAKTRLTILTNGLDLDPDDGGPLNKWSKCWDEHFKSVPGAAENRRRLALAACAKQLPVEYGWYHTLYDEANSIVEGKSLLPDAEAGPRDAPPAPDALAPLTPANSEPPGTSVVVDRPPGCDQTACSGAVTSSLSKALVLRAQAAHRCYDTALAQDPSLRGHVKISVQISADGNVCAAEVASNDLSNPDVGNCIANMFRHAGHFPPPVGGCVVATVPIALVPGG
jgi:hypothetical protein